MAEAFWTGVAMEFGDYDLDWEFDDGSREAQISSIDFQVEDSTEDGVRIAPLWRGAEVRRRSGDVALTQSRDMR